MEKLFTNLDFLAIWVTLIITLLGGLLALLREVKFKPNFKANLRSNLLALIVCIIVFLGGLIQALISYNDKVNKRIAETNARISDSIANAFQDSLQISQTRIIALQREALKQLTDDGKKPIINVVGNLGGRYLENGTLKEYYIISFYLTNASDRNLKGVTLKLSDPFYRITRFYNVSIIDGALGYSSERETKPHELADVPRNFQQIRELQHDFDGDTMIIVNNLPSKTSKRVYLTSASVGLPYYKYNLTVDWTNGSYDAEVTLDSSHAVMSNHYTVKVNNHVVNTKAYFAESIQFPRWFSGIK